MTKAKAESREWYVNLNIKLTIMNAPLDNLWMYTKDCRDMF